MENNIELKRCKQCKEEKSIEDFGKNKVTSGKSGKIYIYHRDVCKTCNTKNLSVYYDRFRTIFEKTIFGFHIKIKRKIR